MGKLLICGVAKNMQCALSKIKNMDYDLLILEDRDLRQDKHDLQYFIDIKAPDFLKKTKKLLAKHKKDISGVINLGRNPAALPCAKIAKELGLPSNSIESTEIASDKYKQFELFKSEDLYPITIKATTSKEVEKFAEKVGYPLVIKPINLSSAIGVRKIRSRNEITEAIAYCQSNKKAFGKKDDKFIVQKFEKGTEHSAEAIVYNGQIFHTGFSDRVFAYDKYDPFFVERGDILPTALNRNQKAGMLKAFEKAIKLIKADNCAVKADLILTNDGPKLIEIHTRLGSPNFWELNLLSKGTNSLRALINVSQGKNPEKYCKENKTEKGVVFECILPKAGVFEKIEGLEKLNAVPGFKKFSWWEKELKKGDVIKEVDNLAKMVAYIITVASSRKKAIESMKKCMKQIKFEVKNIK